MLVRHELHVPVCVRGTAADSVRLAFFTVLYHFGILQWCVRMLAVVMVHLMGTSGAETLSVAANVFMGQTEAPLIVQPYVPRMTNSELFALMASGMAHISGALMVVYISYGADPVAVLTTCVMACPCSLYLAKAVLAGGQQAGNRRHGAHEQGEIAVRERDRRRRHRHQRRPAAGAQRGGHADRVHRVRGDVRCASWPASNQACWPLDVAAESLACWPDDLSLQKMFGWMFSPVAFLMGVALTTMRQRSAACWASKLAINEHYRLSCR